MAVHSINTLQNSDNYNNIAQEYILESLANLGQRYNVKGDSISIGTFYIDKLFNEIPEADANDLLLKIFKEEDDYIIRLVNKNSPSSDIYDANQSLSVKNGLSSFESFYITNRPSVIYNNVTFGIDKNYYVFFGREDYSTSLRTSFFVERFDRQTETLESAIRIFKPEHFVNSDIKDKYVLIYLKETDDLNYSVSVYYSKVTAEAINESEIYDLISNYDLETADGILGSFNLLHTDIYEYDSYNIDIQPTSAVLGYFVSTDQDIFVNQLIGSFENDIRNLFPYLKNIYSIKEYGDVVSIYKHLLCSLYDEIIKEKGEGPIYIPIINKDGESYFSISYTYNTNKAEEIYFAGKEITVNFINEVLDDAWFYHNIDNYRDSVIVKTTEAFSKVSFFYFENELNNESVIKVDVKKISTLPYIDDNGYWIINDVATGIKARGKDAGNPNIIIVETNLTDPNYTILTGSRKEEILTKLDWNYKIAKVEPLEKINLDNLSYKNEFDYFQVKCSIPTLNNIPEIHKENWLEHLENAIIICISPVNCIDFTLTNTDNINYTQEDAYRIYGEYGVITTIWYYDDETKEFEYLRKKNNKYAAADFNYISNINNLIRYAVSSVEQLHPDNYEFTRIVFDPTSATLKNNTVEYKTYLYPTVLNKLSNQYNISNYNNDLNFTFRYNDTIIKSNDGKNIESTLQSGDIKYFNTTYNNGNVNSSNIVTNSLYTYYADGVHGRYREYIPNYNVPSLDLSEVLTRNETLLNRLNILTFDHTGTAYLSYIGTSVDSDKNILTIGTTNTNVNMGTETLISESEKNTFIKQDELNINFENVKLAGDVEVAHNLDVVNNIYLDGAVWSKDYAKMRAGSTKVDTTYFTTIYTATSRYIYELQDKYGDEASGCINVIPEDVMKYYQSGSGDITTYKTYYNNYIAPFYKKLLETGLYNYAIQKNKLYIITALAEYYTTINRGIDVESSEIISQKQHMIYFSDGIYLPALLYQLRLSKYLTIRDNFIDTSNIKLTSNMEIITVNSNPIALLTSSTNLYPDKYLYDAQGGEQIANFTYTLFTSNPMKITYYTFGKTLYLHVEELYGRNKLNTYKKITHNYNVI